MAPITLKAAIPMKRLIFSLAIASFCLLIAEAAHIQIYSFIFDYYFGYIAIGAAIFGLCLGPALSYWFGKAIDQDNRVQWIAGCLAVMGLAISVGTFVPLVLPLSTIPLFLCMVIATLTAFLCFGFGAACLYQAQKTHPDRVHGALLVGAISGVLISPWLLEYTGGAPRVGLVAAITLTVTALLIAPRRFNPITTGSMIIVLGLFSFHQGWHVQHQHTSFPSDSLSIKTLFHDLTADKSDHLLATRWTAYNRTDVVEYKGRDLRWIYNNATAPVPIPAQKGNRKNYSWLRERFPLIAIPLQTGNPESFLSVGPVPGPEMRMAMERGIPRILGLAYNSSAEDIPDQWHDYSPGSESTLRPVLKYTGARSFLRQDNKNYDQIFISIAHTGASGWIGSNFNDSHFYTSEAFQNYWDHVNEGGMLVVTAQDEILFVRALLTVWEVLANSPSGGSVSLAQQAWGFRLAPLAPFKKGPYQHLLIVYKGEVADDLPGRLRETVKTMPVNSLFGYGMKPSQFYTTLYKPGGLESAREVLTQVMSRRVQAWVDLAPATDQRPYFFQILIDIHPLLKWLLAFCLAMLIACLLFPLSSMRRVDSPENDLYPPLPVFFGYFAALGMALAMLIVGMIQRTMLMTEAPGIAFTAVLASMLMGVGCGVVICRCALEKGHARLWYWGPVVTLIFLGLVHWSIDPLAQSVITWPGLMQGLMIAGLCLPLGLLLGASYFFGLRHLNNGLKDMRPWVWIVFATTVLTGTILAQWLAQLWGWGVVWSLIAGCNLAVFFIGLWIWTPVSRLKYTTPTIDNA